MRNKILAVALVAASVGIAFAPKANACGSCGVVNQSAIIDTSLVPVVNTTLTRPAVIDTRVVSPTIIRTPAHDDFYVRDRHLMNLDTPFFGIHLF